ncbi:MAG: shikimate dehydrogenase [Cellulosilyticaceae bacterium]
MKQVADAIKGSTRICGVIGDPIGHTLSPMIHNTLSQVLGQEMTYVPFHVRSEGLDAAIQGAHALGIRGLNVTMPHKQEVMKALVAIEPWAQEVGAVNTLVYEDAGYKGYNTDGYGVQKTLEQLGCECEGQNVAIIGSGGAAYAAAFLLAKKAGALHLFNRTKEKAELLATKLRSTVQIPITVYSLDEVVHEPMYLVVQTTGVGMGSLAGQMPECAAHLLDQAQFAMDMIYSPWETTFLADARAKGVRCTNGFGMLYYQAIRAYELMNETVCDAEVVTQIKEEIEMYMERR